MCGRYALALSNEEVYDALENQLPRMFARDRPRWEREQDYRPGNYNVAPRQRMPIIHRDPQDSQQAVLHTAQWGLIPHWTKHPPTAPLNTINARSESLLEAGAGGMWQALKGYKRCVIPAQGYYEWQKKPSAKVAHFTRLPSPKSSSITDSSTTATSFPLLFFAGLYDTVLYAAPVESRFRPSSDPEDKREPYPTGNPLPLCTYTILTTSPPSDFMWLHDRMPCMLNGWDEVERWLDLGEEPKGWEEGKEGTGGLLRGRGGLECYPVPPEVGKVGTNSPTFIQPVSQRADGIKSFFQKQVSAASPAKKASGISDASGGVKKEVAKEEKPAGSRGVKRERPDDKSDVKDIEGGKAGNDEEKAATEPQPKRRKSTSTSTSTSPKLENMKMEEKRDIDDDEPIVIEDEQGDRDEEPGLGVDSNAPVPVIKTETDAEAGTDAEPKRKRGSRADSEQEEEPQKGESPAKKKRGGHEIKVHRKPEEAKTDQSSITSFFGSPSKTDKPPTGKAAKGGGKPAATTTRKTRSSR